MSRHPKPMATSIDISVDHIETVIREFEADNPGKTADDMTSDEFAKRIMKKMVVTEIEGGNA